MVVFPEKYFFGKIKSADILLQFKNPAGLIPALIFSSQSFFHYG